MTLNNNILTFIFLTLTFTSCSDAGNAPKTLTDTIKKMPINLTAIDTAGQTMTEDDFWAIIDQSRQASNNNYQTQIISLKTILLTLEAPEINRFDNTFTKLLSDSYDYKLWGAAYVINGGCSDDCFDYFRHYLIGHGKKRFYETLKDPESCAVWIKSEEEDNWEGLQYSAFDAYKQKTGQEIPKTYKAKFELKGKPFDEDNVIKQYPKLAKKFISDR